jgi:hypothetical protein
MLIWLGMESRVVVATPPTKSNAIKARDDQIIAFFDRLRKCRRFCSLLPMTDFLVTPNPGIKISSLEFEQLPLVNFHIIVVVEPDPETWMPELDDDESLDAILEIYTDMISDELYPDFNFAAFKNIKITTDVEYPRMIWAGGGDASVYFGGIEGPFAATFPFDFEEYDDLRFYIQGVAQNHPAWRVAVLGAMFEDDVIRVANVIQEAGLDTTVIARYCLSSNAFINLDELFALRDELRRKGLLNGFVGNNT